MFFKHQKLKKLVAIGVFFVSVAALCGTGLAQHAFEKYITQGYTKEEMTRLDQCSTILGLADACGFKAEKELNSVFEWIRKKDEKGLPDLGMVFLDHMGYTAYNAKRDRNLSCKEVNEKLHNTDFVWINK